MGKMFLDIQLTGSGKPANKGVALLLYSDEEQRRKAIVVNYCGSTVGINLH